LFSPKPMISLTIRVAKILSWLVRYYPPSLIKWASDCSTLNWRIKRKINVYASQNKKSCIPLHNPIQIAIYFFVQPHSKITTLVR
jgi:hypothetical protein